MEPQKRFPELKYYHQNVEWVTRNVNDTKNDHTKSEFLALIDKIYTNINSDRAALEAGTVYENSPFPSLALIPFI